MILCRNTQPCRMLCWPIAPDILGSYVICNAMQCQHCHRSLAAHEPIYRLWLGFADPWAPTMSSGTVQYVCGDCALERRDGWHSPRPCQHCGREVIGSANRILPKVIACGEPECRHAASV